MIIASCIAAIVLAVLVGWQLYLEGQDFDEGNMNPEIARFESALAHAAAVFPGARHERVDPLNAGIGNCWIGQHWDGGWAVWRIKNPEDKPNAWIYDEPAMHHYDDPFEAVVHAVVQSVSDQMDQRVNHLEPEEVPE